MTQVELRLPELSGGTEEEQLRQIRTYLFTLAEQLQVAFDGVTGGEIRTVPGSVSAPGAQQERETSFAELKALIIRSAEVTEHFSQEVEKRLAGRYVAESRFGTFVQETEQRLAANSEELRQEFRNLQQIETTLAGVESALLEVNACIRSGVLSYADTGEPVYGVEIGQQTSENGVVRFRKFTRLTADRLSFYDSNDLEVAYISDRRLYITDASAVSVTADTAQVRLLKLGSYTWQETQDGHLSLF